MKNLLIVAHQPSPNTRNLAEALDSGAKADSLALDVQLRSPFDTSANHLKAADGIILFTTENFGYMSGALKDMFDRTYYQVIDSKRGTPYALVVRAGKDGTGTVRGVESIVRGLGWNKVQSPLVLQGDFDQSFIDQTHELAQGFAMALHEGII